MWRSPSAPHPEQARQQRSKWCPPDRPERQRHQAGKVPGAPGQGKGAPIIVPVNKWHARRQWARLMRRTSSLWQHKLVRELGADEIVRDGKGLAAVGGADVNWSLLQPLQ